MKPRICRPPASRCNRLPGLNPAVDQPAIRLARKQTALSIRVQINYPIFGSRQMQTGLLVDIIA